MRFEHKRSAGLYQYLSYPTLLRHLTSTSAGASRYQTVGTSTRLQQPSRRSRGANHIQQLCAHNNDNRTATGTVQLPSINCLLNSIRQGVCCQICKKVPYFRKAGHSGCVRKRKKGSAAMRDGRKHLIGYLLWWRLNRYCKTGFSKAEPIRFSARSVYLTVTTRYWGHEHDYRNNLISVHWGGVVPREVPCNRKESETLRDGPFSGFRQSSSAHLEQGAAGKSSSKSKQGGALSDAGIEVLEGQAGQASQATGTRIDGQPITDEGRDEGGGVDDKFNDSGSETEEDLGEDGDEFEETDDKAQPSRWQSDVLCVADPFIPAKVEFASLMRQLHTYPTFVNTEPRWAHQTQHDRALSRRLPACGDATPHGRKP